MKEPFGQDYAFLYDIFYKNKNYKKECLFLEDIFTEFLKVKPRKILDIACGTGNHAIALSKMGYDLTGIDASKYMVERARQKAEKNSLDIKYCKNKMENFKLSEKFDVIISMFSTINYLTSYDDLESFLQNVRKHLKKNAIFVFDFWNGVAVLKHYSPYKVKKIIYKNYTIKRESFTKLFSLDGLCEVNYKVSVVKRGEKIKKVFKENHLLRYFFIPELKFILKKCGFKVLKVSPFLNMNRAIKPNDWDITVVVQS